MGRGVASGWRRTEQASAGGGCVGEGHRNVGWWGSLGEEPGMEMARGPTGVGGKVALFACCV